MHYLRVTYHDGTSSDELCSISVASDGNVILSPCENVSQIAIARSDMVAGIELKERGVAKKGKPE